MRPTPMLSAALAFALGACASDDHRRPELRAVLDQAKLSLRASVPVALATTRSGTAVTARLLVDGSRAYSVAALEAAEPGQKDILVDLASGEVRSTAPAAREAQPPCPGALPLAEALAVAEATAGGDAVAAVPDDDVACAREIQILVGDVLWEVKVGGDGAVLEKELSDEYSGDED